jgi:hypothetical protein
MANHCRFAGWRLGRTSHLSRVIDSKGLAPRPTQRAQIAHLTIAVKECMRISNSREGISHYLTKIVDARTNAITKTGKGSEIYQGATVINKSVVIVGRDGSSSRHLSAIINSISGAKAVRWRGQTAQVDHQAVSVKKRVLTF